MSLNKRCYAARKYYAGSNHSKSFYEEGFFRSYEAANKFIQEISEEDHDRFLSEIVSYILDDYEPWENEQTWTFDRKGQIVNFEDTQKRHNSCHVRDHNGYKTFHFEPEPNSFINKFEIGDIVVVRAFPWNWESPIPEDIIGVIVNTPVVYDEWVKGGNDKYEWDNTYVTYNIRDGYLDHIHTTEKGLKLFENEIPESLYFIGQLSEHFKGNIVIDEEILKDIVAGKIFVEKVQHFNERESISKSPKR